jgi:uncharacterized protein (TIGR03067 family)
MMLSQLVGTWKVIACQLNGIWLPESIFREFRYNFNENGEYLIQWAELSFPRYIGGFPKSTIGKIEIDPGTQPSSIDLFPEEGPYANQVFQGICEIDYDIFKGNFAFPPLSRPTEFKAIQGQVYEIWQRI